MRSKNVLSSLAMIFSGLLIFCASATAITLNPDCVYDAKNERNLCVAKCQEEFRVDKDGCRNVDHDCADVCRANFEASVGPFLENLTDCKADCLTTLENSKADCRTTYPVLGSVERDTCIDGAQVAAFMCRDQCRENIAASLKTFRIEFRACIKVCPPQVQ
jgi:hypothetical protein